MGKKEVAALIKRIRLGRGETQDTFALRLGISQGAVNKLESGVNEPDKLVCMALATLCSGEEREYFIRRAAGSLERLMPLLNDLAKLPSEGGVTRVPCLIHSPKGGVQEDPRLQILPSNLVGSHSAVRFFEIDGPVQMGFAKKGDIVVLSRWADISGSLEPLLKRPVLVKWFHPADIATRDWSSEEYEGFYLGLLRVKEVFQGRLDSVFQRDPEKAEWIVSVEPSPKSSIVDSTITYDDTLIGRVKITQREPGRIGYAKSSAELPVKEIEISRLHYELLPGVVILGEVVGWFRPAQESLK